MEHPAEPLKGKSYVCSFCHRPSELVGRVFPSIEDTPALGGTPLPALICDTCITRLKAMLEEEETKAQDIDVFNPVAVAATTVLLEEEEAKDQDIDDNGQIIQER